MKQNSTPFDVTEYDKQIKKTVPFYGEMARTALGNFDIQKMVCIDVEKEMLERAESFCDDERVEFLQSDVRELPYKEMFNIVTAIQVNHYLKRDERIVAPKKCYDALEENGIYISFENFAPDSEKGTRLYLERWKEFQIANGKTREEAESHIKRYGQSYFPISISESIELLKDCGFRMVEILWVSYMQVGILARK